MYRRIKKSFTYLGKIYLLNPYIIITKSVNANAIWLIKKNGTSCGTFLLFTLYTYTGCILGITEYKFLFSIFIAYS